MTLEAPHIADYWMSATRQPTGTIVLDGYAPDDAVKQDFAERSGADVHWLQIGSGEPDVHQSAIKFGLGLLDYPSEGRFAIRENIITLKGVARSPADYQTLQDLLNAELPESTVLALAEISAPEGDTAGFIDPDAIASEGVLAIIPAATGPIDLDECRSVLDAFSARNAILFRSGSSSVTPSSELALNELAADLEGCKAPIVHIEGHTDAAGDARRNLALSVARAEAVIRELVQRGIEPQRLYAVGYGETQPIADNGSEDGKRLNRRIVVTIPDERASPAMPHSAWTAARQ